MSCCAGSKMRGRKREKRVKTTVPECRGCFLVYTLPGRIVTPAGFFKLSEITRDANKKFVLLVYNIVICTRSMIKDICFVSIAKRDLSSQQICILAVWNAANIKADEGRLRHREHVIKSKKTEIAAVNPKNVFSSLYICVSGLGRFHRHEITIIANIKNHAYIRALPVFVVLNTAVPAFKKANIFILNSIYLELVHVTSK